MSAHHAITDADHRALQRMLAVQPALSAIRSAHEVVALQGRWLLHAGPPIHDPAAMALPQLNSATLAVRHEGWADSNEHAKALLLSGAVRLHAAQDHGCVIPLADILSPSMPVLEITDLALVSGPCWTTLNGGDGSVLRVGRLDDDCLIRLQWLREVLAPFLDQVLALSAPIALWPLALQGLRQGDDLHGRTATASQQLAGVLLGAGITAPASVVEFLPGSAGFFLNPWMAACKCLLSAAVGCEDSSMVTAMGANGVDFGLQVAGLPGQWFTAPALAPTIPAASDALACQSLGAIGDSAVVDALGFGAMACGIAPLTDQRLARVLSPQDLARTRLLLDSAYPQKTLSREGLGAGLELRLGLRASRVLALATTPVVSLGVLDRTGLEGRLDGGFFSAPIEPFSRACALLERHHDQATA